MATKKRTCATMYIDSIRRADNPDLGTVNDFELWLGKKIKENNNSYKIAAKIYSIPVVVHVIHNGENVGIGTNIPDSQIFSQIKILNEDFRRKNSDTIKTPDEFLNVAADCYIEFVLAETDPAGNATDGIVRIKGSKSFYDILSNPSDEAALKSESYWPSDDYLNIWIANLGSSLLGYAQFPQSNLPGLSLSTQIDSTDGVVIGYKYFGDEGNVTSPFEKGRTATHEIGHYLGLFHIWGDGDCNKDDHCDDTPLCSGPNFSNPPSCNIPFQCNFYRMIQNYLDYSGDACMNLFTNDQKKRMRTVLENSPRRPYSSKVENVFVQSIKLYPNPANRFLKIDFTLENYQNIKLIIFDVTGKRIYDNEFYNILNNVLIIDISAFNNGMYFIKIESTSLNEVEKFVICY